MSGRLVAEFLVLFCEDETAESGVASGFLRRKCRFVSGQLLWSECLDSRDDGRELLVGCDLLGGIGFLGEVAGVADPSGTQGVTTFLEIGVGMSADLSTVVVDHVNGFVTCHS